ncbi:uncharacterized protein LOC118194180 isoform X3 [Stegodyphus dumicola]|uniref:uncharacterized protein LOC118194180 isoform X3 n=1 Tax=Stegodyphus dumicola TaxID=202533 RepID=UPI0015A912C1|nr:uncharacterized protein LOC118194180 isoform X3 [Stegodyphus dumicola]
MAGEDPLGVLIQDLIEEYRKLNNFCIICDAKLKALLKEEAERKNKKIHQRIRRACCLGGKLEPEYLERFQDKLPEIKRLFEKLEHCTDDLKRRYLWSLQRLAEQSICWRRDAAIQRRILGRRRSFAFFEDSWETVEHDPYREDPRTDPLKEEKESEEAEQLPIREDTSSDESQKVVECEKEEKHTAEVPRPSIRTTVEELKDLLKIEELPRRDNVNLNHSGDQKLRSSFIKVLSKQNAGRKERNGAIESSDINAVRAENRMEVLSLIAEIEEKNEYIRHDSDFFWKIQKSFDI